MFKKSYVKLTENNIIIYFNHRAFAGAVQCVPEHTHTRLTALSPELPG